MPPLRYALPCLRLTCLLQCLLPFGDALAAEAFGAPGMRAAHGPAAKSMLGTAPDAPSRIYFTGYRGILSEVYYPTLDTPQTVDLQFLVGDSRQGFVDEEKLQPYQASRSDAHTLSWRVETGNPEHHWRISKRIFTDPQKNALIERVTFSALDGHKLGEFQLYLLFKPGLNNDGDHNSARILDSARGPLLSASGTRYASALLTSLPWKTVSGRRMLSNGYVGASDGWSDLLAQGADRRMDWNFSSAAQGNVAQMGWLDTGNPDAQNISFDLVLGLGNSSEEARDTVVATLAADLDATQAAYDGLWHRYARSLNDQGGSADERYYLAAMSLKTMQDKSNGAMVAGLSTPWGETQGAGNPGGYHLVWPRDLFKFANALYSAGDQDSARRVAAYLFNTLQQKSDCGQSEYQANDCPGGYSRRGRFPQNAWIDGRPYWQGSQMDQQAMPIILAWRLGPAVSGPLWPQIKLSADYLLATGPRTQQERWEENAGYSPSTLAAEIAGLVCAADIARQNRDDASAARYLARADYWQQNLSAWTYTHSGPYGDGAYYLRINPSAARGEGAEQADDAPRLGPDAPQVLSIKNGGGEHDARSVVDGGFLELVRMGVKHASDDEISRSLKVVDQVLGQSLPLAQRTALPYNAWFRYNFDGYGEHNDGRNFDGGGRGRLWPILTAERGMLEIARQKQGSAGAPYLAALQHYANAEGFLPEQIWPRSTTLPGGWEVLTPAGFNPGQASKSLAPLNWAMGEYINLLASIHAGAPVDRPTVVCARYHHCKAPLNSGEVALRIRVSAASQNGEQLYLGGDSAALGNWNPDLALPLALHRDAQWGNTVNLPADQPLNYKYFRKNRDGSVTWESRNGNRQVRTPTQGTLQLSEQVNWP
jgi:glucoamylase